MSLHTNLPTVLTSFIGRQREMADVVGLLASARLVTLIATAGCGKSRLALNVAAKVSRNYEDGVHWVELAPLSDPHLVAKAVARVLHVVEDPARPLLDGLLDALQQRHLLLVLDNCEHLLSACRQLVDALTVLPGISILTTSREPLGLGGEMRYPLAPMLLPPAAGPLQDLLQYDAIRLFVDRSRAILPDFALTEDNAEAVTRICRHLDGIPLAIELASARVHVLTVEQIAARLDDRFELLSAAGHTTHSHHRTLRAAIDWSYEQLTRPERLLLGRLSVFAAGCSLATAEVVCTGGELDCEQILDLLASLVDKSLVVAQTLHGNEARYHLLETIRQYAHEKLVASGDLSETRNRHMTCFLQLTEETVPKLSGQYQQLWLSWLKAENNNLRAALAWAEESNQIETGLRLALALYQFWTIRDYADEGLAWMDRLLARANDGVALAIRANALAYAAFLAGFRGNTAAQAAYGQAAAVIAEAAGSEDKRALAWALAAQAYGARAVGDYQTEFALGKRGIQLNRELGNSYLLGVTLSTYSFSAMAVGEYAEAHAMLDEGLALLREAGNRYRIAMALNFSGDLARCEQNYAAAKAAYTESLALLRDLDAPRDLASALQNLGHTCLHLGDVTRARALFDESLAIQRTQKNRPGIAECLIGFAALAIARNLPASGVRLLAAAVAIGGPRIASAWAATRLEYEHYLALARAGLTHVEFQAEQAAGYAFSMEQAIEYAHDLRFRTATGPAIEPGPDELTRRERDVAALIAQGRSNQEIADELVVSKRTVEKHIANIISKRGFVNRSQIVRWAIETGLAKSGE